MRLIVLFVGPGTGEKDIPARRPFNHIVVDQFAAIVAVQALDLVGDCLYGRIQSCTDVLVRVIAHRFHMNPTYRHVSQGERSGKLSLERRAAVRHRIHLKEAGFRGYFVTCFSDLDAVSQQNARLGRADSPQAKAVPLCLQVPVHRCRAHAVQLFADFLRPAVLTRNQFSMRLQGGNPVRKAFYQILPAGHAHDAPQPNQLLPGICAVLARPTPSSVCALGALAPQSWRGQIPSGCGPA